MWERASVLSRHNDATFLSAIGWCIASNYLYTTSGHSRNKYVSLTTRTGQVTDLPGPHVHEGQEIVLRMTRCGIHCPVCCVRPGQPTSQFASGHPPVLPPQPLHTSGAQHGVPAHGTADRCTGGAGSVGRVRKHYASTACRFAWTMGGANLANTRATSRVSAPSVSTTRPSSPSDGNSPPRAMCRPPRQWWAARSISPIGPATSTSSTRPRARSSGRTVSAEYDGIDNAVSRTSPAVDGNTLYIGDQDGAHLMAIDTTTGALRWIIELDENPEAIITQSPVVYQGVVYDGVSSAEEAAARFPSYPCCSFRGSVAAVMRPRVASTGVPT